MTPEQFCFWLQGRIDAVGPAAPTEAEWNLIREKLAASLERTAMRPQNMVFPSSMPPRPGI